MATSRIKTSSVLQGFPKSRSLLAGNTAYAPGDYLSIASTTIGSGGASSVDFTNISNSYTHLQIRAIVRSSRNTASTDNLAIRVGSGSIDTGSNYSEHLLRGSGSAVIADPGVNASSWNYAVGPVGSTTSGVFSTQIIDFLDYKNTNKYKTIIWLGGYDNNGAGFVYQASGNWRNTAAITDIKVYFPGWNLLQYSEVSLYGIKA
jgi:hypothetical protein